MNAKRRILIGALVALAAILGMFALDADSIALAQGPRPGGRAPRTLAGTAFLYQGQLKKSGALVTSTCNFQFGLWDALSGGTQFGATQTVSSLAVTNGLFTAPIDFGGGVMTGDARWMQTRVQCFGDGGYMTLDPRQSLAPAPMALALPGLYTFQNGTSPNVIGGYSGNVISNTVVGGTIGGGGTASFENKVWADYATVSGGINNAATKLYAVVGGGFFNTASHSYATVGGGWSNQASGNVSTVSGGYDNKATNVQATIGGGVSNTASGPQAIIGGGESNTANSDHATIGGGESNTASSNHVTIGGGKFNAANNPYATVGGGYGNHAYNSYATVGGGESNTASGNKAVVGGGGFNTTSGDYAFVGGGTTNVASNSNDTIGGGDNNKASGSLATIGGGTFNTASGFKSTIGGGQNNLASGSNSFIGGGYFNTVGSDRATISGGRENLITGTTPSYATIPGGYLASARDYGQLAFASGGFSSVAGTAQHSVRVVRNTSATDGAWVELFADGAIQRITIPSHGAMSFHILVVGLTDDDWVGSWEFRGVIKNTGFALSQGCATATCIPTTPLKTVLQALPSGEDADVAADNSNQALIVKAKGNTSHVMRWVATVQLTEVKW